ncbi:MAG TPA: hypothetical protein VF756_20385 [Thermoanaerobaculia bacterium]
MADQSEKIGRLRLFCEEVASVMDRFEDVSRNFVLAEADPADMMVPGEAATAEAAASFSMAAADEILNLAEAPRRRVCIRFGIDPRTGRRVCLQWIDTR